MAALAAPLVPKKQPVPGKELGFLPALELRSEVLHCVAKNLLWQGSERPGYD